MFKKDAPVTAEERRQERIIELLESIDKKLDRLPGKPPAKKKAAKK